MHPRSKHWHLIDYVIVRQRDSQDFKRHALWEPQPAAEIYKYGGLNLTKSLVKLFNDISDSRVVPQEFKDATIVKIYKRKGDKSICDNHRGISLLCIAGKILTRILLNTIDMICAARQVQESAESKT